MQQFHLSRVDRRRLAVMLASFVLVVTLFAGCVHAPETGRQQLLLVSPTQESQLGLQAFEQIKRTTKVSQNRAQADLVRRVGQRIATVAPVPNATWEFVLFEEASPNAFALPGGKVGVHTGILSITKTEAGLATVLAHEVGHVVARHGAERLSQNLLAQVGGSALAATLGAESGMTRELVMQSFGLGVQIGVLLPFSRAQELEADYLGLLYMARAGYDPREALGFWQRFAAHGGARGIPEFLRTHPLDSRRVAELQRLMPRALAEYERARAARG